MLRTNSKQAKEAIRNYLKDGFLDSAYNLDEGIYNGLALPEMARKFREIMWDEWYKVNNFKRCPNLQTAIIEYLKGLPSSIAIAFYYDEERQLIKEWLQQTESESEKYDDEKVDALFWHLISREIIALSDM